MKRGKGVTEEKNGLGGKNTEEVLKDISFSPLEVFRKGRGNVNG